MSPSELQGPFRSESLQLRPLVARDSGELFLLIDSHRTSLGRWLPWISATKAVSDMTFYILSLNGFWKSGLTYGIFENSELVGTIGFQRGDKRNLCAEVGYWLAPPFQGRGLGRKALKMAVEVAFQRTETHRLEARVQPINGPSIAILEKVGFQFEGVQRQGLKFASRHLDHRVYSILRPEFEA